MGPRKKREQADETLGASAGAGGDRAGEGASAAGAPEEPQAPAAEEAVGEAAAADAGLGVQPDADAGAVNPAEHPHEPQRAQEGEEQASPEPSSWDRLAQRSSS